MTDYISAELSATCAALGYYDGHKYHLDYHCIDVIKDLIKYLKRDNESHMVRRFLGQTKLLQTDLIKIFVDHSDNLELWDVLLRLLINLTSPAFIIYNEVIPTEKTMRNLYEQVISYLQAYKVSLTDDRVWAAVAKRLGRILNIESSERGEENELIIERILVFIRNILQVPPSDNERRTDNDATVHDGVLFAFHSSGIVDMLLFVATNISEQQYHLQILEIVSLMLREQNASQLATAGLQRSTFEKEKDESKLLAFREKEVQEKMEKIRKYAGSRHSRFGGTYVAQNMKAIGDNYLICHKPFANMETLDFSQQKVKTKKPKNKQAMADTKNERTSTLSVRLFLKEFCVEFLIGAYNPIMRYARSNVTSGTHEAYDATCYLWILRFFMEFNRYYKFQVKYVSETISREIFHLVQRQMDQCHEMMLTDKKRIPLWSRRLHIGLNAYHELLHTLLAMDRSTDKGVRESSKVIKSNVFYVVEYREAIYFQLLNFDEVKMSRKYLVDLVSTSALFLKMLKQYCGQRSMVVQKVKHKRRKSKKQKSVPEKLPPTLSLEERWDDVGPEVSAVVQEGNIPDVRPFDATLDTPIDDQKVDAMKKIQTLLRQKQLEHAVGLFRSAREVWPENDSFGRADIPPEEEFLALRQIFFADLGVIEEDYPSQQTPGAEEDTIERTLNHDSELDEEEEYEERQAIEETDFKYSEFEQRFANVKIVKALSVSLQQFDKNSAEVNHYVVKLLHQIAWTCKMPAMLFQASIFRTFQRILDSKNPDHKELQKFAVFIIRRFAEVAQNNRKVYMELLFWKSSRDAVEVVDGYTDGTKKTNEKAVQSIWNEAEEDELRTLFMEHQTNKYTQDLIDWLLENLISQNRTRRSVIKKLKEMYLIVNSKGVRTEIQKRLPKEWAEEEVAQLTELWQELKDDDDPLDSIHNALRIKRPKPKIKEKLLELGLAGDPKELRKKRTRKSNHGKSSWETQSVGNSDGDQDSDEETAKSSRRTGGGDCMAPTRGKMTKKHDRKIGAGKRTSTMVYTDAQLSGLLKDAIDRRMENALEWLKDSLEDVLEDRDDESTEGIPLVPLTDYAVAAMDTPSFQKLLRAMNINPPYDEQESYWRIPAGLPTSIIQKRCKLLEDALAGNIIVEEPPVKRKKRESDSLIRIDSDDDDDDNIDVFESVKKFFAAKEPVPSTSRDFGSTTSTRSTRPKKSRKTPSSKHNSAAEMLQEMHMEVEAEVDFSESVDTEPKRSRSESSDRETSLRKKRRIIESDEEVIDVQPQGEVDFQHIVISEDGLSTATEHLHRRARIIISDDDEESLTATSTSKRSIQIISNDHFQHTVISKDGLSTTAEHLNRRARIIISDDDEEPLKATSTSKRSIQLISDDDDE